MACEGERPHIQVYDFFCGGGCFSSAIADEDDVTIAFGVDDWSIACGTFRHNHPHATLRGLTLPATWAALRPPHANAALHAHFSPPCCAFSSARHGRETAAEREATFERRDAAEQRIMRHYSNDEARKELERQACLKHKSKTQLGYFKTVFENEEKAMERAQFTGYGKKKMFHAGGHSSHALGGTWAGIGSA